MASSRRFALVSSNYYPQTCGVGDHSMRLAQELTRRGFASAVFARQPAEVNPDASEVPVVGVPGATPLLIARRLSRELDAFAPTDLILQYTPQMLNASRWGSPAAIWLAARERRRGARVVVIAHELFFDWIKRPDLFVAAALLRVQLTALKNIADHVFVTVKPRTDQVDRLPRLLGEDVATGVIRVGSGAAPVARRPSPGGLKIGTFSTLGRDKRFDVVLDAFAIVHAARPDAELVLLGDLGDRDDPRVRAFHEIVDAHPAKANIRVLGKQSLATIAEEVAKLDVYVFSMATGANTRSSTLPLALGAGLPIVAVRGIDTDDLFRDGENVVFADSLTGRAFADAVLAIASDRALAERLARGASALYTEHLTWPRIVDRLLEQI
jgi:glycosyltransferase involved in cell wall biosynthesis